MLMNWASFLPLRAVSPVKYLGKPIVTMRSISTVRSINIMRSISPVRSISIMKPISTMRSISTMKPKNSTISPPNFLPHCQPLFVSTILSKTVKRNYSNTFGSRHLRSLMPKNSTASTTAKRTFISSGNGSDLLTSNLWQSVLFITGLGAAIYYISPYLFNKTPLRYFNKHPDHLVYLIAAINCAVFGLWQLPQFRGVMERFFLLKSPMSSNFNLFQIFGSMFSHQEFWHLGMNMMGFVSFGTTLAAFLGPANFLTMYLTSGLVGSLFSLGLPFLLKTGFHYASLGASGAVFGLLGCFSWFFPNAGIALFFIPVPGGAWVAFLASLVWNAAGCFYKWGNFDYMAHLGGSVLGLFWGWFYAKRTRRNQRRRYF